MPIIYETQEQIAHNQMLIEKYTSQETRDAFYALTPEQHLQWVADAQLEKFNNAGTQSCNHCYIGKIALVHLYELENQPQ